jgi:hypothetical protein
LINIESDFVATMLAVIGLAISAFISWQARRINNAVNNRSHPAQDGRKLNIFDTVIATLDNVLDTRRDVEMLKDWKAKYADTPLADAKACRELVSNVQELRSTFTKHLVQLHGGQILCEDCGKLVVQTDQGDCGKLVPTDQGD